MPHWQESAGGLRCSRTNVVMAIWRGCHFGRRLTGIWKTVGRSQVVANVARSARARWWLRGERELTMCMIYVRRK